MPFEPIDPLIVETRALRRAVRDLVDLMKRHRTHWQRDAAALPLRPRLTTRQQLIFERLLDRRRQ
jgi:hypothetical protein